ncbi:MAG: thioredoxin family protein [Rhodothermales bacterium]|nr:thioredoxin family protein [Rhodothermales bacterium]
MSDAAPANPTTAPTSFHAPPPTTPGSLAETWEGGQSFEAFLPTAQKNEHLWQGVWDRALVPDEVAERAAAVPGRWHLLVLNADWCGDASNTVPVLARLAERVPNLELRVIERDEHLDLMDAHLTNGRSRSIPAALLLDADFVERGWWGPRPYELQRWVEEEGLRMEPGPRYREVRKWYARDRGRTTLEEVVAGLEAAAEPAA